jgi:cation transporter-like permease
MRKHPFLGLLIACYVALAGFTAWAFYSGSKTGRGWASVIHAWPYLLAGVLTVAAVTGLFVWLAFFSERRGYDERAGLDDV